MERHELGRWGSRGNRRGRRLDLLSALQSRAGFLVFSGGGEEKRGGTCRDRHKRGRRQCFRGLGEGDSGCKTQFDGVGVGTQAQPRTRNRSLSSSSGQIPPPETLEERQPGRDPGKIFPGLQPAAATKVRPGQTIRGQRPPQVT